jgi:synaptosomal-associated protein 47
METGHVSEHLQKSHLCVISAVICASPQILSKLKGLALDAETELERQDEALDGITAAVDQATLTMDKHNRRMRKLT